MSDITYDKNTLFGIAGGQLEFVSQRVEWKRSQSGQWIPNMIMRFTDHDVQSLGKDFPNPNLIEGKYYELSFPIGAYNVIG
jgi:hypothetical protein